MTCFGQSVSANMIQAGAWKVHACLFCMSCLLTLVILSPVWDQTWAYWRECEGHVQENWGHPRLASPQPACQLTADSQARRVKITLTQPRSAEQPSQPIDLQETIIILRLWGLGWFIGYIFEAKENWNTHTHTHTHTRTGKLCIIPNEVNNWSPMGLNNLEQSEWEWFLYIHSLSPTYLGRLTILYCFRKQLTSPGRFLEESELWKCFATCWEPGE